MTFVWSGWGWATFPLVILWLMGGSAAGDHFFGNENLGGAVGGFASCLVLWFWGRHLNRYGNEHTMSAVPMHWWGASLLLFGVATAVLVELYPT